MSNLSVFKSDDGIEIIIDQQTGESFCSVSGYARMSGVSVPYIEKFCLPVKYTNEALTPIVTEDLVPEIACKYAVEHNNLPAAIFFHRLWANAFPGLKNKEIDTTKSMDIARKFYKLFAPDKLKAKAKAQRIASIKRRSRLSLEYKIQLELLSKHGGRIEVQTDSGRIDLLSSNHLFEIKMASNWKSGVGQLLIYGTSYPDKQKVLYLFGDTSRLDLPSIRKKLSGLGICLEIHS